MIRRAVLIAALSVAGLAAAAAPASATECTPKGCTGGCHLNPNARDLSDLIVCYS